MKFVKVKKKRLYVNVLSQLEEYLTKEKVVPGKKLPSERELASMFDVSRLSVREALAILEANGLVERKVGGGTFSRGSTNFAVTTLLKKVAKKSHLIKEPMEVRRVIEPQLARLAAINISDELLKEIRLNLKLQQENLVKGHEITSLDRDFHFIIAKATNNTIFIELIEALRDALEETRVKSLHARDGSKVSYQGHEAIYAALESHNPDKAEDAMAAHLIQVEKLILDWLVDQEHILKS